LRRRNAPIPIVATAAVRASARANNVLVCVIEDSDMTSANERAQQSGGLSAAESYAMTSEEAESRSEKYRGADVDPFPEIPPALLSSEHIKAYVRETGMIYPFRDDRERLKSASYEVNAGGQFIYWDEKGNKIATPIKKDGTFTLPPNSISFVQIESRGFDCRTILR
jgi:hypothetical protein